MKTLDASSPCPCGRVAAKSLSYGDCCGRWLEDATQTAQPPDAQSLMRSRYSAFVLHLFQVLDGLRKQGTTIVLITHKLKEVMRLCDEVTVMRAGRVVQSLPVSQASVEGLAEAMVGRKVNIGRSHGPSSPPGQVLLQARNLLVRDALQVTRLRGLNLRLHAGEIVGIAGVSGNGQSELLDVLSGLLEPASGQLELGGRTFEAGAWLDPGTARELGLAHVPEDRQARALVMNFKWEPARSRSRCTFPLPRTITLRAT